MTTSISRVSKPAMVAAFGRESVPSSYSAMTSPPKISITVASTASRRACRSASKLKYSASYPAEKTRRSQGHSPAALSSLFWASTAAMEPRVRIFCSRSMANPSTPMSAANISPTRPPTVSEGPSTTCRRASHHVRSSSSLEAKAEAIRSCISVPNVSASLSLEPPTTKK